MNAGITGHTIFPQIVFLANIFLDLAIRIPRHIESNFPWSGVRCRVIDRGFIGEDLPPSSELAPDQQVEL